MTRLRHYPGPTHTRAARAVATIFITLGTLTWLAILATGIAFTIKVVTA